MDNEKLATELLRELKASSQRWFFAFITMFVLEIATIAGFLWYISLPIEEASTSQVVEDARYNDITQTIGGGLNESDSESNLQEESNKK